MELNEELQLMSKEEAVAARERLEANISNIWGHSIVGFEAKKAAMSMLSTKSGLYAKIPITCKAHQCPYADSCVLLDAGLATQGEKCPWETALIETRYAAYVKDYNLDESSFTDRTLISELVNIDVMLERTKALLAKEQVPITEVVAGMTESGEEYTRPEVSKAYELYDRNLNRKERILDSMLGTRKSKKGQQSDDTSDINVLLDAMNQEFLEEQRPSDLQ